MTDDLVIVDAPQDGVIRLRLNRPERRNALTVPLLDRLLQEVARAEQSEGARVLVLSGSGDGFCSGMDLHEAADVATALTVGRRLKELLVALVRSRLLTVAVVRGPAVAGGAALVLACDFALAADDAKFGFPELRRGIVPAMVATLASRRLGDRAARELALGAEVVPAARAGELGAFTRVVPAGKLEEESAALCAALVVTAPQAAAEAKRWLDAASQPPLDTALDDAYACFARSMGSAEAAEGLAAFRGKREPAWARRDT